LVGVGILILVVVLMASSGTYVVQPGYRGVQVTMGRVSPQFKPEGFGLKTPLVTAIIPLSIRQQTAQEQAEAYSADLQQVVFSLRILYRIPESSVVKLFKEYLGDPFDSLIAPRVQEAIKEATALQSAEQVVKNREYIKTSALQLARKKVGEMLVVEDIVIENITLTKELERAIEAKMVQEQEAAKSKFVQQRAQIEADTAVIKAKGEAESIRIRGQALRDSPTYLDLQVVDKWDGVTPLVIGGGDNLVFPLQDLEKLGQKRN
jgi:prohibitin 2